MNVVQRLFKNMGFTAFSQFFTAIIAFILLIYIARYLGEDGYGIYNFALSFTILFTIFSDLGITQFIIREIARKKAATNYYLTNAFLIKCILSIVAFGLIVAIIWIIDYPQDIRTIIYLFAIYNILISFSELFTSIFQANEKMEYASIVQVTEKLILITLGLYVIFSGYGLLELAYVYIFAALTCTLVGLLLIPKVAHPKIQINHRIWKDLTLSSLPFGINAVFAMIFFKIDVVLLGLLDSSIVVGIYSAAYNPLLSLSMMLTGIVITAIYPVMSRYFIDAKDSLTKLTILTLKYMGIIGFPIAVGCFVLADKFILLFYGGQYLDSVLVFQILAFFIPIRLTSSITGTFLYSTDKQNFRSIAVVICAFLNIALNITLIPFLSYIGAAIATIISEIILYILYFRYIKVENRRAINKTFLKPLLAALIMGIICYQIKEINLLLVIVTGMISYFVVLMLLNTFTKEDKDIIRQLLR